MEHMEGAAAAAGDTGDGSSAVAFKISAAILLFAVAATGGLLPLVVRRGKASPARQAASSAVNCAAAGVLLASGLCHMLPESADALRDAWGGDVPWGHLLCGVGFMALLSADYGSVICAHAPAAPAPPPGSSPLPGAHPSDWGFGAPGSTGGCDSAECGGYGCAAPLVAARARSSSLGSSDASASSPAAARGGGGSGGGGSGGGGGARRHSSHLGGHRHDGSVVGLLSPALRGHSHALHHGAGQGGAGGRAGGLAALTLVLGLSLHSVMEGLGIGANVDKLWGAVIAVLAHKGLVAYAIGASLVESGALSAAGHAYAVCGFASMTPLGIVAGMAIIAHSDGGAAEPAAASACVAAAAGTFLYVSLMELLPHELGAPANGGLKLVAVVVGFAAAAVLGVAAG